MNKQTDPIESAIANLGWRNRVRFGKRLLQIVCLVRENDWRPLKVDWWRGKEVCVIGADVDGNFFLRHCDGSVRLWDHKTQSDSIVAQSVREFISSIND